MITLQGVLLLILMAIVFSCLYDWFTYEDRQTAWEKAHPGQTYIRHYRKLTRDDTA